MIAELETIGIEDLLLDPQKCARIRIFYITNQFLLKWPHRREEPVVEPARPSVHVTRGHHLQEMNVLVRDGRQEFADIVGPLPIQECFEVLRALDLIVEVE